MNMEQIEAFLCVSVTANFSKAGELLFISQPTVSSRIKALEKHIGYRLFNRSGKNITLTKEGKKFLPYAEQVLKGMQEGILAVHQSRNQITGELHISIAPTIANFTFYYLMKAFHECYPNIKISIHTGYTNDVLDMVLNQKVSLGISRTVENHLIETSHLIDDEIVLAIYPNHAFATKEEITLEEIADEPFIVFTHKSQDYEKIRKEFISNGIKLNVVMEVDEFEIVKRMVKNEMGVTLLPNSSIKDEVIENELKAIQIRHKPKLTCPINLIYLKEMVLEGISKTFSDFLINKIQEIYSIDHAILRK